MQAGRNKPTIIVVTVSTIIIVFLVALFYFFTEKTFLGTQQRPVSPQTKINVPIVEQQPEIIPTEIIAFTAPSVLPEKQEAGSCFASSVAYPYRQDAFRCMVGNSIHDPCFTTKQSATGNKADYVYCQTNPLDSADSFLIKMAKPLPKVEVPATAQDNWAWFVKLKDGTECSPFTGTRPFLGEPGPNAKVAYYGCVSQNPDEQIVLIGDLNKDEVWTAEKAILTKDGRTIKSTQKIDIETIWQ